MKETSAGPARQLAGAVITALVLRWLRWSPFYLLGSWRPSWFDGTSYSLLVAVEVLFLAWVLDFLAGKRIDIEPNEYAWIFVVAYFAAAILGDILGFIGHFLG